MRQRDDQRAAVYAAEHSVEAVIAQGGKMNFYGSTLDLPPMLRFGDIPTAQKWVDHVWEDYRAAGSAPTVVARRGEAKAVYHSIDHTIRLPRTDWGMTVFTLAHETAHAYCAAENIRNESAHGSSWRRVFIDLIRNYWSMEAALLLMESMDLEVGL